MDRVWFVAIDKNWCFVWFVVCGDHKIANRLARLRFYTFRFVDRNAPFTLAHESVCSVSSVRGKHCHDHENICIFPGFSAFSVAACNHIVLSHQFLALIKWTIYAYEPDRIQTSTLKLHVRKMRRAFCSWTGYLNANFLHDKWADVHLRATQFVRGRSVTSYRLLLL